MNHQLRDEYGNPVRQIDEYGNPVQHSGTMGAYDTGIGRHAGQNMGDAGYDPTMATGYGGQGIGTGTRTGHQGGSYDTGFGTGIATGHQGGSYDTGTRTGHQGGGYDTGTRTGHQGGGYDTGTRTGHQGGGYDPGFGTGIGTGHQGGSYDTGTGTGMSTGMGGSHGGQHLHQRPNEGGLTGTLHRSGSGSSSSEDDGLGGRRKKKGMKEKIKEKLPGGHKQDEYGSTNTHGIGSDTYGRHTAYDEQPEKKGIMDKIKDKLPGM